jgi:thiol-disulfide isomerase/thioredoxin
MAQTPSTMRPLGTSLPPFALPDPSNPEGSRISSADVLTDRGLVVMFLCNHCPFVKHLRDALARFGQETLAMGVGVVAISSNDAASYPEDGPEAMAREKADAGYVFPYLYDDTQAVARAFDAACTPDFYLFNGHGYLVYRGQFDASRPGNGIPITGKDLRDAVAALVEGRPISPDQVASLGCNIKWKSG